MAIVAAPVMGSVGAEVISAFGDSILVELGLHAGFSLTTEAANDLFIDKPLEAAIPIHSKRLETTAVKVLLITLKYKMTMADAALGFYRSSVHKYVELGPNCLVAHYIACTETIHSFRRSRTTWPSKRDGSRRTFLLAPGGP